MGYGGRFVFLVKESTRFLPIVPRKRSVIITFTAVDPQWSAFRRLFEQIKGMTFGRHRHIQYLDEPATEPSLPLLTHLKSLEATDWIRTSVPIFGRKVSSLLPGDFPGYARVYHPFEFYGGSSRWHEQLTIAERDAIDPAEGEDFALRGARHGQARVGSLAVQIIGALLEHLVAATTTPDECYFAIWEGFGGLAVPSWLTPKLELPGRAYHVFTGPLQAALTSYDQMQFLHPGLHRHMSANLWWPADHAWCVATEIDNAWTYVGASRACIDAVLADPRIESVETSALSRW